MKRTHVLLQGITLASSSVKTGFNREELIISAVLKQSRKTRNSRFSGTSAQMSPSQVSESSAYQFAMTGIADFLSLEFNLL